MPPEKIDVKCSFRDNNDLNCNLNGTTGNDYHHMSYRSNEQNITVECEAKDDYSMYICSIPARKFSWSDQLTIDSHNEHGHTYQNFTLGDICMLYRTYD